MCGISGILGYGWTTSQLEAMVNVMAHRGPDDNGFFIDEHGLVGLGHNRLSIIDLSSAGHQPMKSYDDNLILTFNGEIYNYIELRQQLGDYLYQSNSDTEVILAAYQAWGEQCVNHFNGQFAFAIWDADQQHLFCARDRLGIKPFYYAENDGLFMFASEIKALIAGGYVPEPDYRSWSVYLVYGHYDHTISTFFNGVSSLPPGHTMTIVPDGTKTLHSFWELPARVTNGINVSDDKAAERFVDIMEDAVRLRLRSDVPVGVNLSGGLDSSTLMTFVDHLLVNQGQVETFTASFADHNYDEKCFADAVPRKLHWERHIQRLNESEVWSVNERNLWHQEAPYGGIATLAYYHLHQLARDCGVTVLLEGQGVDEMLAGYNYFYPYYYRDLYERGDWQTLRREIRLNGQQPSTIIESIRLLQDGTQPSVYQDGTSHLRLHCVETDILEFAGPKPEFDTPFNDHLSNALYRDLRYTKLPRVLRMNDHLSMAFSRELREPFLDHRVVEFLFSLPGHQKIRKHQNKFIVRHAMRQRMPAKVFATPKRNVVTPQREWLRTVLKPQVEDIIHSKSFSERGFFNVGAVQQEFEHFCENDVSNSFFVWQWINLELWFRMFIDNG